MLNVHWLVFLWLNPSGYNVLSLWSKSSGAFLDHSDHRSLLFGLSYHCVFHDGRDYKNVPIIFFVWNPSFLHRTNLNLGWYWLNCSLNLVIVEQVYCFRHILQVSRYTTHILLQSKWKFILKASPITVLLITFPGSNVLYISQLLCPQGNFPLSSSLFSLVLDLTNL